MNGRITRNTVNFVSIFRGEDQFRTYAIATPNGDFGNALFDSASNPAFNDSNIGTDWLRRIALRSAMCSGVSCSAATVFVAFLGGFVGGVAIRFAGLLRPFRPRCEGTLQQGVELPFQLLDLRFQLDDAGTQLADDLVAGRNIVGERLIFGSRQHCRGSDCRGSGIHAITNTAFRPG